MEKDVLGLNMATDPRWVNIAEKNLQEILVDHAYCEQKAASSCISLIVQFPDKQELVDNDFIKFGQFLCKFKSL